jgi:hypothetical protein
MAVQRALALADFGQGLVERPSACVLARLLTLEIGHCATDCLYPSLHCMLGGTAVRDHLLELSIELADEAGQVTQSIVTGPLTGFRALRCQSSDLAQLSRQAVNPLVELSEVSMHLHIIFVRSRALAF